MIITFCFLKLNVKWKNFDIKYQMEFIVNIRKIPKKNTIYLRYHIFRKFLYIIIIRRPWAQEHKSAFSSKLIKLLWCRSFYLLLCCNDFVEYSQIWDGFVEMNAAYFLELLVWQLLPFSFIVRVVFLRTDLS